MIKATTSAVLTLLASAAMAAAPKPATVSAQDAANAKAILGELLAIDTSYDKGTVAAVKVLRGRAPPGS